MVDSSRQALETPSSDFNTEELPAARGCPLGWHMPTPWHNNGNHCYFCFYKGLCAQTGYPQGAQEVSKLASEDG